MEKQIVENRLGNFYDQKWRHNETETYLYTFFNDNLQNIHS